VKKIKNITIMGLIILICIILNIDNNRILAYSGDVTQASYENAVDAGTSDENKLNGTKITDIEIGEYEGKMYAGKTQTISATVLPSEAATESVIYRSSNENVAKVSSTGEVKGISKGSAIIYVTAGDITKELHITVNVETAGIVVNSTYVVLKQGEIYKLVSQAQPKEAEQDITYKVVDDAVAQVSQSGQIEAKSIGSTTILVTNGEYMTSVTLIVNSRDIEYKEDSERMEDKKDKEAYDYNIDAKYNKLVDAQRLHDLYESKKAVKIQGDGYTITIDGTDIVNYNNEFRTDIKLQREKDTTTFTINEGDSLCGSITLDFTEKHGKYVYLYNESKGKYELLNINGNGEMVITSAGKYMITSRKLSMGTDWVIYVLATGVAIMIGGSIAYIAIKKKYWFW